MYAIDINFSSWTDCHVHWKHSAIAEHETSQNYAEPSLKRLTRDKLALNAFHRRDLYIEDVI